jgi:tetratricopeptide (TPR) repeat protein
MASGSDPDPEDSDLPVFQDRGRWIGPILLTVLVVAVVALFATRPIQGLANRMRTRALIDEGTRLVEQGRWDSLSNVVQSALLLAPTNPAAIRLAARYHSHLESPEGLTYWQALLAGPAATPEDRRTYVRHLQHIGRVELALPEIRRLLESEPTNLVHRMLLLEQLALVGNWTRLASEAEATLKLDPGEERAGFLLAQALIYDGDPGQRARAVGVLKGLKKPGRPGYEQVLRTLASIPGLDPSEAKSLAQELEDRNGAGLVDLVLAAELRESAEPNRKKEIVDGLLGRLPQRLEGDDVALLGNYLRSRGRHDAVLALSPKSAGETNGPLAVIGINALMDLGRWDEVMARITNAPALDLVTRQCTLALYANQLGRIEQTFDLLKSSAIFAVSNLNQLRMVANLAEQLGESNLVMEIWTTSMRDPRQTVFAANQLLRIGAQRDDYTAERRAYRRLLEILPEEPTIRAEANYLAVLHDDRLQEAHDSLLKLVSVNPSDIRARAALALAKLQLGDRDGAQSILETGGVDWEKAGPRWQAVRAAVLEANRQPAEAKRIAAGLAKARLKAPERRLLEPVLGTPRKVR